MRRYKIAVIFPLTACLLALTACGGPTVQGTYKAGQDYQSSFVFDDGKFTLTVPALANTPQSMAETLTLGGQYELKDDQLILTFDDAMTRRQVFPLVTALLSEQGVDQPTPDQLDGAVQLYLDGAPYLGTQKLAYDAKTNNFTFNGAQYTFAKK